MFIVFFGAGLHEEYGRASIELWADEAFGWCIHTELMPMDGPFLPMAWLQGIKVEIKMVLFIIILGYSEAKFFFMSPWCYALLTLKSWFWNISISVNRYNKFCTELQKLRVYVGHFKLLVLLCLQEKKEITS